MIALPSDLASNVANRDQLAAWDGPDGDHWTQQADRYEHTTAAYRTRLLEAGLIEAGDSVVDVGCGTGSLTRAVARLAPEGSALGLDLSRRMLQHARDLTTAEGIRNASYEQADVEVREFAPASMDVVVSSFGCMFFGNALRAFGNLASALRPGGRCGLLAWRDLAHNEWVGVLRAALAAGRDLPVPTPGTPGPFGLADANSTRELLAGAGLVDIDIQRLDEQMNFGDDADQAYEFVSGMGFTRGLTADLDPTARAAALGSLRAAIDAAETDSGVLFASSAWLITARRG
jgi:SAM-dependent methyltransferase